MKLILGILATPFIIKFAIERAIEKGGYGKRRRGRRGRRRRRW